MNQLLADLSKKIPLADHQNTAISTSNVGWHIEHSLLVINGIIIQLQQTDPASYKWQFKWAKIMVFWMNKIPRGKGKAPKIVQPQSNANQEILEQQLQKATNLLFLLTKAHRMRFLNIRILVI